MIGSFVNIISEYSYQFVNWDIVVNSARIKTKEKFKMLLRIYNFVCAVISGVGEINFVLNYCKHRLCLVFNFMYVI